MSISKKISSILYYMLIALEVMILIFAIGSKALDKTPSIFGYSFNVIVTGSMEPEINIGDVIISKDIKDPSTIQVGDVITYQGIEGSMANKRITHKVEEINYRDNKYYFITKGVNNTSIDPEISEDQLISKYVYKTHVITFVYGILSTLYGFILLIVVPVAYMIIMEIVSMFKENKEDKENETKNKEVK